MTDLVRFRVGSRIFEGEKISEDGKIYTIRTSMNESLKIHTQFILKEWSGTLEVEESTEGTASFLESIFDQMTPYILANRPIVLNEYKFTAVDRRRNLVCIESKTRPVWVPVSNVLEDYPQLGTALALEYFRPILEKRNIVLEGKSILDSHIPLAGVLEVYMKDKPFRDMTRLREGTYLEVSGYDRGCATIIADGENFWVPLDEEAFTESIPKDDEYYKTMDMNHDKIPDPLEYLPSKVALGKPQPDNTNNYQNKPELSKSAGHFAAIPDIDIDRKPSVKLEDDDYSVLDESYAAFLLHYNDEAEANPETHPTTDDDDGTGKECSEDRASRIAEELVNGAALGSFFDTEL